MAALAAQQVPVGGLVPTMAAAAAGGDTAPVGDNLLLQVKNGDAASKNVTLVVPGNLQTGDAYPDKVIAVAAGATALIPLSRIYRDPADGRAHITYSAVTSVTVGVIAI